jgi:hypothetical protein
MSKLPKLRSPLSICLSFMLLLGAVFFLPYFFPVSSVVSLSSVVGYNNHIAVLIFVFGSLFIAILSRDHFQTADEADQNLSLLSLLSAMGVALLCCCARIIPIAQHVIGLEAKYHLNRIQMLASGHVPYVGFEYIYGPVHLYLPVFLARISDSSVVRSYYVLWIVGWLVGTFMFWVAVKLIDLPLRRRTWLFWIGFAVLLPAIQDEGVQYTPVRTVGPAFLIVIVAYLWKRSRDPMLTVVTAILSVGFAFASSPEQGIAIFIGLLTWFILLAFPGNQTSLSAVPVLLFTFSGGIIAGLCWHLGEFEILREFSSGATSFPLLPSLATAIILSSYLIAACTVVSYLFAWQVNTCVIPLFLVGYALLPAALGRCDLGHMMTASPLFLLGVAAIESRPALRRVWSPLALWLLVVPLLGLSLIQTLHGLRLGRDVANIQKPNAENRDPAIFSTALKPCPLIYRTFIVIPKSSETSRDACLETGYYYMTVLASTQHSIGVMLRDLQRPPARPILMFDVPLADQLRSREVNPSVLRSLELSIWVPRRRNPPFSYETLIDAITRDYTPSPQPTGGFRIWYPKSWSTSQRSDAMAREKSAVAKFQHDPPSRR